jgi:hypothetical protein
MSEPAENPGAGPRRWPSLLAAVIAALLATVAFLGALDGGFVIDDETFVVGNPAVTSGAPIFTAATPPDRPDLGLYRPLTTLTHRLQFDAVGLAPRAFRALNVALHALASALLALLATRIARCARTGAIAGALFAVHPIHVEAVAWISGRAEVLATCFAIGAMWVHACAPRQRAAAVAAPFVAALLYGAAALAKESALALPLAFVVVDRLRELSPKERVLRLVPAALIAVLLIVGRFAVLDRFGPDVSANAALAGLSALQRLELGIRVLGFATLHLLAPRDLSLWYEPSRFAGPLPLLAGIATGIALVVLVVSARRRGRPAFALGAAWFAAGMIPFLHVVPIAWIFGDRFVYLASGGAALLVAGLLRSLPSRAALGISAVLTALLLASTASRVPAFHSSLTVFEEAVAADPESAFAHFRFGEELHGAGRDEFRSDSARGAVWHWRESLRLEPRHGDAVAAHRRLADYALRRLAEPIAAVTELRAALALDPGSPEAALELAALHEAAARDPLVTAREALDLLAGTLRNPRATAEQRALAAALAAAIEEARRSTDRR